MASTVPSSGTPQFLRCCTVTSADAGCTPDPTTQQVTVLGHSPSLSLTFPKCELEIRQVLSS